MTHAQAGSNDSYPPSSKELSPLEVLALNKPTDVVRLERDYASGEGVCQFWSGYPSELEDRVCFYKMTGGEPCSVGNTGQSDAMEQLYE